MAKKAPKRCIFCGGRSLTQEHIIPDWIQGLIPKKPNQGQLLTINKSGDPKIPPAHRSKIQSRKIRQGHPISKKVRFVCIRCNTGWLSVLENELKTRITNLIPGTRTTLTPWDQRRLATWAAKTAMTAEFVHPDSVAVTFDERELLRLLREPPPTFNIWVGHYAGSQYTTELHHQSVHLSVGEPIPTPAMKTPNTQTTIIGLGKLFLQVSSSSFPGLEINLQGEGVGKLQRIWPARLLNLSWPLGTSLTDNDIRIIMAGIHAAFSETI